MTMSRKVMVVLAALAVAIVAAPGGLAKNEPKVKPPKLTTVKLLAFNDFHGHLEAGTPGSISVGATVNPATGALVPVNVPAGGAEYFATHLKALGSENPDTYVVSAGDLIGGSPLLSGLFHDEPTIEFMNSVGLDTIGVGNHEFDEGKAELLRMQYGNRVYVGGGAERRHVLHPGEARRLPSGRRLPGRDAVLRLGVPVSRRERDRHEHEQSAAAFVPDREHIDRREDRLHRRDVQGHAARRHPDGRGRSRFPRRGGHGQRSHPDVAAAAGADVRSAPAPGRLPERTLLGWLPERRTTARTSPGPSSSTSSTGSVRQWTWS